MTNLMTHKHVIDTVGSTLPHGQGQNPSLNIELCSCNLFVFNNQVLSGKQFCQLGLDFIVDCHWVSCLCE